MKANKPKDGGKGKEKPAKDSGGGGGKQKRKKWSKGKTRDKLNNLVLFDKPTYDKLLKEVPGYKLITPSVVSERLKIRGSLARAALKELASKSKHLILHKFVFEIIFNFEIFSFFFSTKSDLIRVVSRNHSQEIYTKIHKEEPEGGAVEKAEQPEKKEKPAKKEKAKKAEEKEAVEAE